MDTAMEGAPACRSHRAAAQRFLATPTISQLAPCRGYQHCARPYLLGDPEAPELHSPVPGRGAWMPHWGASRNSWN